MRQSSTLPVRGVPGDGHPYRDMQTVDGALGHQGPVTTGSYLGSQTRRFTLQVTRQTLGTSRPALCHGLPQESDKALGGRP